MKNLKIFEPAVSAKVVSCALTGALAATALVGCSGRNSVLDGTVLEDSVVVTFSDDSKDVAIAVESCEDSSLPHYQSVTSGVLYGNEYCSHKNDGFFDFRPIHHYSIINEENILQYLTLEELKKANNDELTEDDIITIIERVSRSTNEKKVNVK